MKGWSPLKYSHRKPFYIPDRARIEPQKIFVMGNLDKYMTIVEKPELHITLQVQSLKIFLQFLDRRPPKRWVLLVIPLREFPNQRPMERLCDLINMRRFEIYCRRALMWSSAMLFLRGARIINFGILPTKYDIKIRFLTIILFCSVKWVIAVVVEGFSLKESYLNPRMRLLAIVGFSSE